MCPYIYIYIYIYLYIQLTKHALMQILIHTHSYIHTYIHTNICLYVGDVAYMRRFELQHREEVEVLTRQLMDTERKLQESDNNYKQCKEQLHESQKDFKALEKRYNKLVAANRKAGIHVDGSTSYSYIHTCVHAYIFIHTLIALLHTHTHTYIYIYIYIHFMMQAHQHVIAAHRH